MLAIRTSLLILGFFSTSIIPGTRAEEFPPPSFDCDVPLEIPDCTPKQECETRQDSRECTGCLVNDPFRGGCMIRARDPLCEAAKVAQNAAYAQSKLACETSKAAQQAQCESAKASIVALNAQRAATCKSGAPTPSLPSERTR
jgi:hypothetical protein